jgi:predicted nucleic acid-binding Zn ribbon protein
VEAFAERLAPATLLAEVQRVWGTAVGPAVAGAARPTAERDGVITVTCEAAVWAHELDLMAPALLARLNGQLGRQAVASMRCRVGS